ncbi:MAG TPA: cation-transporting P-type ATPase [Desulfomonilia bacterium]
MEPGTLKKWHTLSAQEVLELLASNPETGLTPDEASNRAKFFGLNVITAKKTKGPLIRFLLQFNQPLVYILLAAALITFFLKEYVDSGVIFGVVIVNAVIGFFQESKAVKAIEALAKTMTTEATVIRSHEKIRISSELIVPGDIILLQSGDKVPADMRIISAKDLQTDESALTGESVSVEKSAQVLDDDIELAERKNMAFGSSLVTYGTATGVVTETGNNTEVGRISSLMERTDELETPLLRKISHFSKILLYVILLLAALTFLAGIMKGQGAVDMFMAAVALAVGAIPEGLPAALTITLAIGVSRMAKRGAIIRNLPAVETLGSTTVICSDKTGTLTENQMTVQEIMTGYESYLLTGSGYSPDGEILHTDGKTAMPPAPGLAECLRCGILCNDSRIIIKEGRHTVQGDPTEGALITSAAKAGLDHAVTVSKWTRIDTLPFESQHQYMATLNHNPDEDACIIYMKGSLEAVLERCAYASGPDGGLTEIDHDRIHDSVSTMASKGMRILAFAFKKECKDFKSLSHDEVKSGMTFIGLQGMIDPPRAESVEAIRNCHSAGIHVKMITGDHALTASAIAQKIGLRNSGSVLTGRDISKLGDVELSEIIREVSVFARVAPEQKLKLVSALQSNGNIVAMTGDGVNDAPALKRADIGVAMGITGTDVAKEAADIILTDDNFATIEAAVEEGRGTFDNITKFIVWTLPTNLGEGLVILAAIFAGAVLPILPVQILWINMTTAVLLGLMLVFEPKEEGLMKRKPREPGEPILTGRLIWRIFMVGLMMLAVAFGLFEWELKSGSDISTARTVAVNVFVMVELFYLFTCRSLNKSAFSTGFFSNRWLFAGVFSMIALQLLFTYLPLMNRSFQSSPVGLVSWLRIIAASVVILFVVELEKKLLSPMYKKTKSLVED